MAAAGGRDVSDAPAAEAPEQLADLGRLALDVGDTVADAARIKVDRQHSPGGRPGVVDRRRARLVRRIGGQRASAPGRVSAAAVARDPDVRRARDRGRDRMPGGLCDCAREAVRTGLYYSRRVARGQ